MGEHVPLNVGKRQAATDANGYCTVEHNAGTTPFFVETQGVKVAGPDAVWQVNTDSYTETTFRARCLNSVGTAHANKIVELFFVAWGIPPEPPQ